MGTLGTIFECVEGKIGEVGRHLNGKERKVEDGRKRMFTLNWVQKKG